MTLSGTFAIQAIKKKTQAKFFKDLHVGSIFTLEYTLNGGYENAPAIRIVQKGETMHYNNATQLRKNLSNFEVIEVGV